MTYQQFEMFSFIVVGIWVLLGCFIFLRGLIRIIERVRSGLARQRAEAQRIIDEQKRREEERIAAERERQRLQEAQKAEKLRLEKERQLAEAKRIADEQKREAERVAAEKEQQRLQAELKARLEAQQREEKRQEAERLEAKRREEKAREERIPTMSELVLWQPEVSYYWQNNKAHTIKVKIDVLAKLLVDYVEALTTQQGLKAHYSKTTSETMPTGTVGDVLRNFATSGGAGEQANPSDHPVYRGYFQVTVTFDNAHAGVTMTEPATQYFGSIKSKEQVLEAAKAVRRKITELLGSGNVLQGVLQSQKRDLAANIFAEELLIAQVRLLCNGVKGLVAVGNLIHTLEHMQQHPSAYLSRPLIPRSYLATGQVTEQSYFQFFVTYTEQQRTDYWRGVDRALGAMGLTRDETKAVHKNQDTLTKSITDFENYVINLITTIGK